MNSHLICHVFMIPFFHHVQVLRLETFQTKIICKLIQKTLVQLQKDFGPKLYSTILHKTGPCYA